MTELSGTERSVIDAVSGERLMADTEAISHWVRMSGSEEERKAFDHAENALHEMGVQTQRYLGGTYVSLPEEAKLEVREGTRHRPFHVREHTRGGPGAAPRLHEKRD